MLIHAPEIVDSNTPELAAYEAVCPAMLYFVGVIDVEVMKYESSAVKVLVSVIPCK